MKKRWIPLCVLFGALSLPLASFSAPKAYSVNYTITSQHKALSLKNAVLHIKLYTNGNLRKRLVTKTNDKQLFFLDNPYGSSLVVEVASIKGEPKNMNCYGATHPGQTSILIDCHVSFEDKDDD